MSEADTVVVDDSDIQNLLIGDTISRKDYTFVYSNKSGGKEYDYKITDITIERLRCGETVSWGQVEMHREKPEISFGEEEEDTVENETVTLEVEVDVSEASSKQQDMYAEMADIFADRFELFIEKNLDYDSSFVSAGKVEQSLDNGDGPFDSEEESNLYKLFTRIQDKDQRFYSLAFTDNEDRVGETAAETAGDAGVYWFMVQWLIEYYNE